MNKTKAFSYDIKDDVWFRRLEREARQNGRTNSGQLIFVIRHYFDHQTFIKSLGKEKETDNGSG